MTFDGTLIVEGVGIGIVDVRVTGATRGGIIASIPLGAGAGRFSTTTVDGVGAGRLVTTEDEGVDGDGIGWRDCTTDVPPSGRDTTIAVRGRSRGTTTTDVPGPPDCVRRGFLPVGMLQPVFEFSVPMQLMSRWPRERTYTTRRNVSRLGARTPRVGGTPRRNRSGRGAGRRDDGQETQRLHVRARGERARRVGGDTVQGCSSLGKHRAKTPRNTRDCRKVRDSR